jgi:hypothetical protein
MTEEETKEMQTALEKLRLEKQELTGNLAARDSRIVELEQAAAAVQSESAALREKVAELDSGLNTTRESLTRAVAGYRTMLLSANPEIPAEMVVGDTLEAIELAVSGARALIGKVKEQIEKNSARVKIPAGAPQRTAPDLSGLSAREKIIRGIEKK